MTQVRFDFLNLAPDKEDTENTGLTIADNVVHDTEGYKPIHLGTAVSVVQTGNLGDVITTTAVVTKSIGVGTDTFSAWIDAIDLRLHGFPLSFSRTGTSQTITAFDVTESNGKIFFVVEAQQSLTGPLTTVSLRQIGYLDFLDKSVEFSPGVGSLSLAGAVPTVIFNGSFPATGTLALTGFAPTVTIS